MPRHLGENAKRAREAAERENAALAALPTADPAQIPGLVEELTNARLSKRSAKDGPRDTHYCAWCRDGRRKKGAFTGKARLVMEVTLILEFDGQGEQVREERHREQPVYLEACGNCLQNLGLVAHLNE